MLRKSFRRSFFLHDTVLEGPSFDDVADLFVASYDWYRYLLSALAKSIGAQLQIGGIKPLHVTQWLDNEDWNSTTHYKAARAVKRAFNWAIKEGRLTTNPLRAVERPAPNRRETFFDTTTIQARIGKCF